MFVVLILENSVGMSTLGHGAWAPSSWVPRAQARCGQPIFGHGAHLFGPQEPLASPAQAW